MSWNRLKEDWWKKWANWNLRALKSACRFHHNLRGWKNPTVERFTNSKRSCKKWKTKNSFYCLRTKNTGPCFSRKNSISRQRFNRCMNWTKSSEEKMKFWEDKMRSSRAVKVESESQWLVISRGIHYIRIYHFVQLILTTPNLIKNQNHQKVIINLIIFYNNNDHLFKND